MNEDTIRAFAEIVEKSLQSTNGKEWLKRTHKHLLHHCASQKFNTERALEMYTIAIERSVLASISGSAAYMIMKELRESGITNKMASELVDQFKAASGARDQRRARTGIWAQLVGK